MCAELRADSAGVDVLQLREDVLSFMRFGTASVRLPVRTRLSNPPGVEAEVIQVEHRAWGAGTGPGGRVLATRCRVDPHLNQPRNGRLLGIRPGGGRVSPLPVVARAADVRPIGPCARLRAAGPSWAKYFASAPLRSPDREDILERRRKAALPP